MSSIAIRCMDMRWITSIIDEFQENMCPWHHGCVDEKNGGPNLLEILKINPRKLVGFRTDQSEKRVFENSVL